MPGAFRPALLPFWEVMGERIMYRGYSESISRWGTNHVPSLGIGTTPTLQGLCVPTSPPPQEEPRHRTQDQCPVPIISMAQT